MIKNIWLPRLLTVAFAFGAVIIAILDRPIGWLVLVLAFGAGFCACAWLMDLAIQRAFHGDKG